MWMWLTNSQLLGNGYMRKLCTRSFDKKFVDKTGLLIAQRSYCSYYLLDTYLRTHHRITMRNLK